MGKLLEFFQEDNGGMSMSRLVLFFLVVVPFIVWILICIHNWSLAEMPGGILGIQGGALAQKYFQKKDEQSLPPIQPGTPGS